MLTGKLGRSGIGRFALGRPRQLTTGAGGFVAVAPALSGVGTVTDPFGRMVAAVAIELDRQYDPQRRVTEEHVEVDRYYEPIQRQVAHEHVEVDRYYLPIKRQLAMIYIEIDVVISGGAGDVQLIAV
jgi:hypothetical protein